MKNILLIFCPFHDGFIKEDYWITWCKQDNATSCQIHPFTQCPPVGANTWWRHQMETFSVLLVICARNSPVPGEFPTQSQWRGALMLSLICVWINGWVNNGEAGDLRRYRGHYVVTVM